MSTPFGEEDMSADVKTRVSTRQVEWGILQEFNVSPEGKLPHIPPSGMDHLRCLQEWTSFRSSWSTTPASE